MHCQSCDKLLSDRESTRRNEATQEFEDLCDRCYSIVQADLNENTIEDVIYVTGDDTEDESPASG